MKEDERLFSEHDEDGVAKFGHFWQNEHKRPKSRDSIALDETASEANEYEVRRFSTCQHTFINSVNIAILNGFFDSDCYVMS